MLPSSDSIGGVTVWIRCYAELNDYLPAEQRFTDYQLQVSKGAGLKTIVEDLGIPFARVDMALVNGESVESSYVPNDSDRISVYPVFESFDISPIARIRAQPLRITKFVLDVHLGKLAYYLRMLGFDSVYRNDFADAELLGSSLNEGRILLSKDRTLLADERLQRCYRVREKHPREQVIEVVERFDLFRTCSPLARCIRCNVLLEPARKQDVLENLPPRVAIAFEEFRRCPACKRVYWKGSHYERMMTFVQGILNAQIS